MATTASPDAETGPGTTPRHPADRYRKYEFARSSRDLLRLVAGLILLLTGLTLATIFSDALLGFETDLVGVVRGLPDGLTERAIYAARHALFFPAQKDGRDVSQNITFEYHFNINVE